MGLADKQDADHDDQDDDQDDDHDGDHDDDCDDHGVLRTQLAVGRGVG